jgi:hypothetical protein
MVPVGAALFWGGGGRFLARSQQQQNRQRQDFARNSLCATTTSEIHPMATAEMRTWKGGSPTKNWRGSRPGVFRAVRVVCGVRAAASQPSLARRCSSGKGPAVNHYTSNLNPGQGTHASSRRLSRVFFRTHSARQSHVSGLTSNSELRQRSEPSGPCLALCSRRAARRTRQRRARTAARQRTRTRRPAGARPHTTPGLAPAINEIHTQIAGIARATPDRGPHRAPTTVQTEERRIENHENGIKRKKNLRKSKKTVARTEFDCTGARTTRPRER